MITLPDREPDFLIGPPGNPYMRRWWLVPRNNVFNLYLHEILHDDPLPDSPRYQEIVDHEIERLRQIRGLLELKRTRHTGDPVNAA